MDVSFLPSHKGKLPALRLAGERELRIQRKDLIAYLETYKPEKNRKEVLYVT